MPGNREFSLPLSDNAGLTFPGGNLLAITSFQVSILRIREGNGNLESFWDEFYRASFLVRSASSKKVNLKQRYPKPQRLYNLWQKAAIFSLN